VAERAGSQPAQQAAGSPGTIVPRWEWRSFGDHFGAAEDRLAGLTPERSEESDEIYLLTLGGTGTVKIRAELLDIKHLEQIDDAGLEQWTPVMKAAFPLAQDDVATVFAALGTDAAVPQRDALTYDEMIDAVVGAGTPLLVDHVHKLRRHFTVNGCMIEVTDVTTDHGSSRTLAVEATDPAAVIETVELFGLRDRPNTSYPRGLKALAGFGPRRCAVIDVGTNSVKFHVAELGRGGVWHTVVDRSDITRLGEGLAETGRLNPEPTRRTVDAIAGMVTEARQKGAVDIAAVGTAGMRMAENSQELIDAVRQRCGITIEVLSGEEESRIAYLGVKAGIGEVAGSIVVFDTGGGSSQFTFGQGDEVAERFSVNVGAVRYTERFGLDQAVSDEELEAAMQAIAEDLERLDGRPAPDAVVALGGAVTNLAAVKHEMATYDPDVIQGTVLERSEIDRQIQLYRERSADQRRSIVGLQPKRAEVILAGACVVRTVMGKLQRESLTVSDRGLRHGLVAERFGP